MQHVNYAKRKKEQFSNKTVFKTHLNSFVNGK